MIANILKKHYENLLFRVSLNELEDKEKLYVYLKNSLINEYTFSELYNMMDDKEKFFYNILKPNFSEYYSEREKFYNFCRIYVQYLLNIRKKQNESELRTGYKKNSYDNAILGNNSSNVKDRIDLNVDINNLAKNKPVIKRKDKYTVGEEEEEREDEKVMILSKTEYMASLKKNVVKNSHDAVQGQKVDLNINEFDIPNTNDNYMIDEFSNLNIDDNYMADEFGNLNIDDNYMADEFGNLNIDDNYMGDEFGNLNIDDFNISNPNSNDYSGVENFLDNEIVNTQSKKIDQVEEKIENKKKGLFGGFKKNRVAPDKITNNKIKDEEVKMSKNLQQKMG